MEKKSTFECEYDFNLLKSKKKKEDSASSGLEKEMDGLKNEWEAKLKNIEVQLGTARGENKELQGQIQQRDDRIKDMEKQFSSKGGAPDKQRIEAELKAKEQAEKSAAEEKSKEAKTA